MKLVDDLARHHEEGTPALAEALAELVRQVAEHDAAEEETLYAALVGREGAAEAVERARSQHEAIGGSLDRLGRALVTEHRERSPVIEELRIRLAEHVEFEETTLFDLARRHLDEKEGARLGNTLLGKEPLSHPIRSRLEGRLS
jgi:hypothetical protein